MPIVRWRAAIRGALYLFLGWLGLNALLVPLSGTLSYLAVFIYLASVLLGLVIAVVVGVRVRRPAP